MMVLQQQVNQLDRFVIQQESIPNFVATPTAPRPNQTNLVKVAEEPFLKNVNCLRII